MATKKVSTRKSLARKTKPAAKRKPRSCKPTYRISQAGHLLKTANDSSSGSVLSRDGKKEKAARRRRGCLSGVKPKGKSFKLSAKQKRNLPPALQKAILKFHHGR